MDNLDANQEQLKSDVFNPKDENQRKQLIDRLSNDEKKEIGVVVAKGFGEYTLTRLLPLSIVIVGGTRLIQHKLPAILQTKTRRFLFQGAAFIGASEILDKLFPPPLNSRINEKFAELYQKHSRPHNPSRYDLLREANRQHQSPSALQIYNQQLLDQENFQDSSLPTKSLSSNQDPRSRFIYDDSNPYYISGTPTSESNSVPQELDTGYSESKDKEKFGGQRSF